jgi:hypothetical protein
VASLVVLGVHHVALGAHRLRLEVMVARLAAADLELSLVLVAAQASAHRRQELFGVDLHLVAARAVVVDPRRVLLVREAEVMFGGGRPLLGKGRAVTAAAGAGVVRFGVALQAALIAGEVERPVVFGGPDPRVAVVTAHPLVEVGAVLEGPPLLAIAQPEQGGAREAGRGQQG